MSEGPGQRPAEPRLADILEQSIHAGPAAAGSDALEVAYLCASTGQHAWAFAAQEVVEVMHPVAVTSIPRGPAYMPGALNRRGRVTPVFDLATFVGRPSEQKIARLLILEAGDTVAAVPVGRIDGLVQLASSAIKRPLPAMEALGPFVRGYFLYADVPTLVIEASILFAEARKTGD